MTHTIRGEGRDEGGWGDAHTWGYAERCGHIESEGGSDALGRVEEGSGGEQDYAGMTRG
jgi:hypothetical protein